MFSEPEHLNEKPMPPLAGIILDFTIPQRIQNYPRADGIQWPTGPRALGHGPRSLSENAKRTLNENPMPAVPTIILDFTIPRRIHNYPKADVIQWPTGTRALGPGPRTLNENAKRTLNENPMIVFENVAGILCFPNQNT